MAMCGEGSAVVMGVRVLHLPDFVAVHKGGDEVTVVLGYAVPTCGPLKVIALLIELPVLQLGYGQLAALIYLYFVVLEGDSYGLQGGIEAAGTFSGYHVGELQLG